MPELPEVEHVVRGLRRSVLGSTIVAAELNLPRLVSSPSAATFKRKLRNARIDAINRRGKYILFELNSSDVLLVHLRMTGKFLCIDNHEPLPAYAHVVFYLDDDRRLVFSDMRQFGRLRLLSAGKLPALPQIETLAPEPFTDGFSLEYFRETLSKSRRSLKQLLLDQTKILGLGNIYASEALFLARISPLKSADTLLKTRAVKLHQAIRDILDEAIAAGSTLRIDLTDRDSSYIGTSERFWRVYERAGEPCVNCSTKIRRVVQGGRSTYYCPKCQRS
ncbi:MAG TPA: bifunctional DNA-formamidopyrimidine glycosylase/DNA-(apurinic or apyrimidinic site) lyase [Pyrinomonadaceae bacterium]|jgi:formamidopyrimidine-DNA glycosylase|nr:bifunctional DNA-formamidopyrimidine glycosylase/DNA-(apurinic or apyrimidinic site) lyase [Pyrinomonadaceae bacterium]